MILCAPPDVFVVRFFFFFYAAGYRGYFSFGLTEMAEVSAAEREA